MRPFICEHTCEYCVAEGCEERRNLPIGTRTSNLPIEDCDNVNVIVKGNGIPIIGVNKGEPTPKNLPRCNREVKSAESHRNEKSATDGVVSRLAEPEIQVIHRSNTTRMRCSYNIKEKGEKDA